MNEEERKKLHNDISARLGLFLLVILALECLYILVLYFKRRSRPREETTETHGFWRRLLFLEKPYDGLFSCHEIGRWPNALIGCAIFLLGLSPQMLVAAMYVAGYIVAAMEGWSPYEGPTLYLFSMGVFANFSGQPRVSSASGAFFMILLNIYVFAIYNTILSMTGMVSLVEGIKSILPKSFAGFVFVVVLLFGPVSCLVFCLATVPFTASLSGLDFKTSLVDIISWMTTGGNIGLMKVNPSEATDVEVHVYMIYVALVTVGIAGLILGILGSHEGVCDIMDFFEGAHPSPEHHADLRIKDLPKRRHPHEKRKRRPIRDREDRAKTDSGDEEAASTTGDVQIEVKIDEPQKPSLLMDVSSQAPAETNGFAAPISNGKEAPDATSETSAQSRIVQEATQQEVSKHLATVWEEPAEFRFGSPRNTLDSVEPPANSLDIPTLAVELHKAQADLASMLQERQTVLIDRQRRKQQVEMDIRELETKLPGSQIQLTPEEQHLMPQHSSKECNTADGDQGPEPSDPGRSPRNNIQEAVTTTGPAPSTTLAPSITLEAEQKLQTSLREAKFNEMTRTLTMELLEDTVRLEVSEEEVKVIEGNLKDKEMSLSRLQEKFEELKKQKEQRIMNSSETTPSGGKENPPAGVVHILVLRLGDIVKVLPTVEGSDDKVGKVINLMTEEGKVGVMFEGQKQEVHIPYENLVLCDITGASFSGEPAEQEQQELPSYEGRRPAPPVPRQDQWWRVCS